MQLYDRQINKKKANTAKRKLFALALRFKVTMFQPQSIFRKLPESLVTIIVTTFSMSHIWRRKNPIGIPIGKLIAFHRNSCRIL